MVGTMLSSLPFLKKNLGASLQSRKAMLETLFRHLDMVRLSAGAIAMIALVGCTGLIDGGSDGLTAQQREAKARWKNDALPALRTSCVVCHNGSRAGVGFLEGASDDDIHTKVLAWDPAVVNLDAPGSSRLITKDAHEGPALTAEQTSAVLQWIQSEREGQASDPTTGTPTLVIPKFAVTLCTGGLPDNAAGTCPTNHVSLSALPDIGAMLPGAELSFVAQGGVATALYLTDIKLNGGTMGANIVHPLFVSRPAMGDAIPDKLDRFFDVKMNEKATGIDPIGNGAAAFVGFNPADMLEVHFKEVKLFQPDTTTKPPTNTCKELAKFKANVVPQLVANATLGSNCVSCHTGGGNGKGALDMTGVAAADDATLLIACNQVRQQTNLVTPASSVLYLAPDPGSATNHPFKFTAANFTTYKNSVDVWVQAEKIAP
jgi:cytochrome c553